MSNVRQSNVERFSGFQDLYDQHRPGAPEWITELLVQYLGRKPSLVVDAGCGTGLSTFIWRDAAERVIGVEPNSDMRSKAEDNLSRLAGSAHISFVPGYSTKLGLDAGTVDIITCSQSFHWMEPVSTLQEFSRVLADGGIVALYDCDWPPAMGWEAEKAYHQLIRKSDEILAPRLKREDAALKRSKEEHLARLEESGAFRFTRELVFHHAIPCDAERVIGLALSQGGVQSVLKLGAGEELRHELDSFIHHVEQWFAGRSLSLLFGYRLRLGLK